MVAFTDVTGCGNVEKLSDATSVYKEIAGIKTSSANLSICKI